MLRLLLLLVSLAVTCPLFSQSLNDELETIVVSASRTPVSAGLSGCSVHVIDRQHIENRQIASLGEILRDVPGLAVNRGGVLGSATQIRVRGAEANQLLVFIDGVEVNDLAQGSEFNFAHLSASEIESAEVIRGPQSALWGSDALAGVINIRTKKGEGPLSATAFAEGGSFGTAHGGATVSGGGRNYHFNLAGSYLHSSGDNISRDGNENDAYENGTLSFSAGFMPTETLSFDLVTRLTEARNEFDGTDFFTTGLPVDTDSETKVSQNYTRLQSTLELFDGHWQQRAGVALSSTDNDNFLNGLEGSSNQGKKYRFDYQSAFNFDTVHLFDASHNVVLAYDYEIEEFTQRGAVSFGNDPNQDRDLDTNSFIAEYRVTLDERLSLSAGFRHDNNSDFQNANTFRTTAAYWLEDYGLRIHGNYGTGVKNPTFTERFGFFASSVFSPFIGNPNLKPEKSRGWEVGVSKDILDERLKLSLTYFNQDLEDEINGFFFDVATLTSTAINETGKSKREGLELGAHAVLDENMSLSANYTYLDASQPGPSGQRVDEVRRPEHLANANLNYRFLDNRAMLNLSVNYNGKQDDFFFPPPLFAQQTVSLNSFTLVNVAGSYQLNDRLSLYARVENLLDDTYEEILGFRAIGIAAYAGVRLGLGR